MATVRYVESPCKSALNRVQGMPFDWSLNPYRGHTSPTHGLHIAVVMLSDQYRLGRAEHWRLPEGTLVDQPRQNGVFSATITAAMCSPCRGEVCYRGCRHRCAYCYARTTHAFMGLDAGSDFDNVIFAKTNLPEVLRREVRRPGWTRPAIAIGTATDPYQPIEGRYRITRSCLAVLADAENPANIITKGTLVVRDLDVLQDLARRAGCDVNISLISLDESIWRAFEAGTPPPAKRLAALRRLADAGVPCGLALAPVLPRLTDSLPALEAVVRAAVENGAQWLWSGTLHFEPAVRDWFFEALQRHFPQTLPAYERVFGAAGAEAKQRYAPTAYSSALLKRVAELKARYGLASDQRPTPRLGQAVPASKGPELRQLPLPW